MNIYSYNNIKDLLNDELYRRSVQNPQYSLRAFARDLEMSSSRLSEILSDSTNGVSRSTVMKIAKQLQLTSTESDYLLQISICQSKTKSRIKDTAQKKLNLADHKKSYRHLTKDFHGLLEKWHYLLLLELCTINENLSLPVISSRLGLTESEITEGMQFLLDYGYMTKSDDGRYEKSDAMLKIESAAPSSLIQNFHIRINELGRDAVKSQPIDNRKFLTSVLAFDKKYLHEARTDLEQFMAEFNKKYMSPDRADTVYCTTLQFFEVQTKDNS